MKSGLEHVEYDTHHNVANAAFFLFFLFSFFLCVYQLYSLSLDLSLVWGCKGGEILNVFCLEGIDSGLITKWLGFLRVKVCV